MKYINGIFIKIMEKLKNEYNKMKLENEIENRFSIQNLKFRIYLKNSFIKYNVFGYYDNGNIVILGNHLDKINGIIKENNSDKTSLITSTSKTKIKITINNIEYTRIGTIFTISDNIEEVDVIKVDNKYFKIK